MSKILGEGLKTAAKCMRFGPKTSKGPICKTLEKIVTYAAPMVIIPVAALSVLEGFELLSKNYKR